MAKNKSVKKAIEAISSGNARELRKSVNEALLAKVRKALEEKEKQIAKSLIESAGILNEEDVQSKSTKVKVTQGFECEHPEGGSNLVFKVSYETSVPTKLLDNENKLADYLEIKDEVGQKAIQNKIKAEKLKSDSLVTWQTLKVVDSNTSKTYLK